MSNVKIKANASGTADFTIQAPATDSALTLTLPDSQGTLLTNAAGDVESAMTTQFGRRNLIINGGFDVWQRGTSFSISGSVPYTADRWKIGGGTSTTVSRQTFTVGQTDVPNNPTYYCRWDMPNNSQYYEFTQKIENVGTASGQSLTISYYAKRNSGSLNPQLQVVQDFGSGGSSAVVTAVATPSLTSSWTKYTYTVSVPSISGKTLGTGHCLYVRWQNLTTDTGQIDIANVQAELGSVATPFEHRSYGEELALCQRYYIEWKDQGDQQGNFNTTCTQNDTVSGYKDLPVWMRVIPTVTSTSLQHSVGGLTNGLRTVDSTGAEIDQIYVKVNWTHTEANSHTGVLFTLNGGYVRADAEL